MRIIWLFLLLIGWAGSVLAGPAPPPPADFGSDQYVDGKGCVYNRSDGHWTARRDADGTQLCGFPPSLSARRTDPDTTRILHPLSAEAPRDPEELLLEKLSEGLHQGEFAADDRAPKPVLPAAPLGDGGLSSQIKAQLELRERIRATMMGGRINDQVCARLGYRPPSAAASGQDIAPDVTLGMCPGMGLAGQAALQARWKAVSTPASQGSDTQAQKSGAKHAAASAPKKPEQPKSSRPKARKAAQPASAGKSARQPKAHADPNVELIPASARYILVGTYSLMAEASKAEKHLAGLGYSVARNVMVTQTGHYQQVMAGPFGDRRSLVVALKLLREGGYKGAYAR